MSKKSLLDRDNVELYIMSDEEQQELIDMLKEQETGDVPTLQEWQEEVLKKEVLDKNRGDEKFGDIKEEARFYGVVKSKKAEMVNPTESQILNHFMDYGYTTIEDIIRDYGEQDMIREWYINNKMSSEFYKARQEENIFGIDWDSEWETVEVVSKDTWEQLYNENYVD